MSDVREIFPVVMVGDKATVVVTSGGTRNPDGSQAGTLAQHFADVPEPTAEELALLEAGGTPPTLLPEPDQPPVLDPPVDPDPDLAGVVGKGKGAAAKG